MRVKVTNNIIKFVTDITLDAVQKRLVPPTLCDEKGNVLYKIAVNPDGRGDLSQYGIVANSIEDGKLAVVITERMDITADEIKQRYGKAIIAAQKFCPLYAAEVDEAQQAVDAAFEGAFAE
jgi:hypothetical protein